MTNPYTFSIQGNINFSGICELASYVIAYGSEPWYYSRWPDASKVSDLTTINGGVKFSVKNVIYMSNMFEYCSGLTSLDLSNFNTSNVTSMGYMFEYCSGLTSLDLSNFNTSNVTSMGYMFNGCSGLISLDLSNFDTSNVTDMSNMFQSCSALETLDYSLNGFLNNGKAPDLSGCAKLKTLRLHHTISGNASEFVYKANIPSSCKVVLVD